jgi:hypothetical protein
MATVLAQGDSASQIAQNQQAISGIRTSDALASKLDLSTTSTWEEPSESWISSLFPSNSTYHYLYSTNKSTVTAALDGIQEDTTITDQMRACRKREVKEVVSKSWWKSAVAHAVQALILVMILSLVWVFSDMKFTILPYFMGGFAVVSAIYFAYAEFWAEGKGEAYWTEYMADLSFRQKSGSTLGEIAKEFREEEQQDANRTAMAQASSRRYSGMSSGIGTGIGMGVGAELISDIF